MVLAALAALLPQSSSTNMNLQAVTLERVTKNNAKFVAVMLRPIYHDVKKIEAAGKKPWWKAIVRLVDKKGQGLYAEIRGSTQGEVQDRAKVFFQPKFLQVTQIEIKQHSTFSGWLFGGCVENRESDGNRRIPSSCGGSPQYVSSGEWRGPTLEF